MATKTIDQISAQSDRAQATLTRLQKTRQAALRRDYLNPDGSFPAAKNGEWRIQNARNDEYFVKAKKLQSIAKRENQIETAANNLAKKAKAASKAAVKPVATVTKTAIKTAAAGGDPYAKAWATRIAKYGPAGVAPGKLKK